MNNLAIWLSASLLLCMAEIVVPGQVTFGLGVSGLLVTLLLWTGLVSTWPTALVVWLVASVPTILVLRLFFAWIMPGDIAVQTTDEDSALEGQVVQVVETIEPAGEGRVAFGGSTWPAISLKERLVAGLSARLMVRTGLVWVVKPVQNEYPPEPQAGDRITS
ncbi:MAG: NfeD family protein [Rhodospirillaceae bacterium]